MRKYVGSLGFSFDFGVTSFFFGILYFFFFFCLVYFIIGLSVLQIFSMLLGQLLISDTLNLVLLLLFYGAQSSTIVTS